MGATTSTSKKKTTSRAKKISLEEAEEAKKKAVQEAREEARKEFEQERLKASAGVPFDEDIAEYEGEGRFPFSHPPYYESGTEPESGEDFFDIFQYGQGLEEQGRAVEYLVKKNNEIAGELATAIRWSDLAKKYGGGKYQIILRDANTKEYIRSQTQRVGEPTTTASDEKEKYFPPQPQMPQMDLNQTFQGMSNMFMQMQEMVQREKTRTEREEKKSSESFNSTLFNLINQQSQNTSQMIMEMQKQNMEMIRAMSDGQTKAMEKAEERNREMIREMKESLGKKEEFGLKEMLAMIESSRNNGMDTMKTVMELSETFAEMRTPDTPVETDSKDSLLSKLVSGMMPLLTKATNQANAAAPGVTPQIPGQVPGVAPHPTQVVPGQRPPQPTSFQRRPVQRPNPQAQKPAGPIHPGDQRGRAPQAHAAQRPSGPFKGPGTYHERPVPISSAASLGFTSLSDKGVTMPQASNPPTGPEAEFTGTESSEEIIKRTQESINEASESILNTKGEGMSDEAKESIDQLKGVMPLVRESDVYKEASKAQQDIVELGLPIIAHYINDERVTAEIVAHFVIDECNAQGYTAKILAKEFTFDFLLQIASNFGLGEEKKPWFGEFYETIKDAAGNAASGKEEPAIS